MKYETNHGCLWWMIIGLWWIPLKMLLSLVKWLVLIILLIFVD